MEYRKYVVKNGDTLWGIAKKLLNYSARYVDIVRINGLKTATLQKGQKLALPRE